MAWFKRESGELDTSGEKKVRTEGLWVKCEQLPPDHLEERPGRQSQCLPQVRQALPHRRAHSLGAAVRRQPIRNLRHQPGFDRSAEVCRPEGLLLPPEAGPGGYRTKDAILNARGKLNGRPVIVSAMEYSFIGGSMGAVVGEEITRAIEQAAETRTLPSSLFPPPVAHA